jgi:hypothetical protein
MHNFQKKYTFLFSIIIALIVCIIYDLPVQEGSPCPGKGGDISPLTSPAHYEFSRILNCRDPGL